MSTKPYLLALDQGTSSSRSIVFDPDGRIVAMAQREFTQHFPQSGWVEHDAIEIWATQLATAKEVVAKAGITAQQIAAIGITNQRETTVVWNRKTGEPIHRAIVWQDRRTAAVCERMRNNGLAPLVAERTGLVIDPYFSGTKLAWILDAVPGARAAADAGELAFGTVDSWLVWNLTRGGPSGAGPAVHVTDASNAARTMLYDIRGQRWSDQLLTLLKVPPTVLPRVVPSSGTVGDSDAALLGAAIPIAGIAGDQQSALFGQACFSAGLAKNTYGTGCFMLMHTGSQFQPSHNGLITTAAAQPDAKAQYAIEGSVFVGGAVVQWMRDGLKAIDSSAQIQTLAQSVPDSGGVVFVPAFTGLGAPYWKPDARGAILGLSRGSTMAHIARAALESIAFQSTALLNAMNKDAAEGGTQVKELRVDGGASNNDLLMQMQADLSGIPVVRPTVIETTALGAAYLAGLAVGTYRNTDELANRWKVDKRFEPQMSSSEREARLQAWDHAVRQSLA
jgi:glycerol kinase